jgi:DNA-binding transcriptional ArsR family regulator
MKSSHTYHVFFSNLANPLRVEIISALKEKEGECVNELSARLGVEQSKLSHALSALKKCNLVIAKRNGKHQLYFLNKRTMLPILKIIDKHAKDHCRGKCLDCVFRKKILER